MGRHVFLEEIAVADCAFEVEGRDLSDLFETVASVMAEIMVDPATIAPTVRREMALSASALDLLLFDWIAELIFVKDSEQLIFTDTVVEVGATPPWRLTARGTGGVIDRVRTSLRADAKAPTLHQFALVPAGTGWRARVVIDL